MIQSHKYLTAAFGRSMRSIAVNDSGGQRTLSATVA